MYRKILLTAMMAVLLVGTNSYASEKLPFEDWVAQLKKDAVMAGVSKEVVAKVGERLSYIPNVYNVDAKARHKIWVDNSTIDMGNQMAKDYAPLLKELRTQFGVPEHVVLAVWGVETSYGKQQGSFYIPSVLASMSYEDDKKGFYRSQLLNLMTIVQEEYISTDRLLGGSDGEMGQPHFLPSTFLRYAVDYNSDGKRDIWDSEIDSLASIANYLAALGWNEKYTWGREVQLPEGFNSERYEKNTMLLKEWSLLGISSLGGKPLPDVQLNAKLVVAGMQGNRAFLVYDNFQRLLSWKGDDNVAIKIGLLADAIHIP